MTTVMATRESYIETAGSEAAAIAYENQALNIGDEFLPKFARDVRDGGEGTAEYWQWLQDSLKQAQQEAE